MKSHTAEFTERDVMNQLVGPLIVVAVCAGLFHFLAALNLLPSPRPTLDTDRTLIVHQAETARKGPPSEILLIGDSSCLMDVSAPELARQLGQRVLNLGTVSYLDLNAYSVLLREYTRAHTPKVVVLLMHPEALRRLDSEPNSLAILNHYLAGTDHSRGSTAGETSRHLLGIDIFTGRLLARWLPTPLRGAYGAFYGFSHDLENYLEKNQGSAIDPGSEKFGGNAEYRLAPTLAKASQTFRAAVPPSTRLFVGITPAPEGFVGPAYVSTRDEMLGQWREWLNADATLAALPATLADDHFARVTHLKPAAISNYTHQVGLAVAPLLNARP